MKLFIKNMVSIRCKLIVKSELEKLGLEYTTVDLGEVAINDHLSSSQTKQLDAALRKWGLELMEDKRAILIEQIKNVIIETIHYSDEALRINFSDHLSEQLQHDYTYLSNLFSETTGTTIEHFIIKHKIERAKELMVYEDLPLTEIAYKLHYSTVAHLSSQFKKITGLTPTFFKHMKRKRLNNLEDI